MRFHLLVLLQYYSHTYHMRHDSTRARASYRLMFCTELQPTIHTHHVPHYSSTRARAPYRLMAEDNNGAFSIEQQLVVATVGTENY
jgi:hypothetical protein